VLVVSAWYGHSSIRHGDDQSRAYERKWSRVLGPVHRAVSFAPPDLVFLGHYFIPFRLCVARIADVGRVRTLPPEIERSTYRIGAVCASELLLLLR
jgi:hypothetical protein